MKKFETWRDQRTDSNKNKSQRLASGSLPRSGGRGGGAVEDDFISGFNESRREREGK
jgi:hypothetical protein